MSSPSQLCIQNGLSGLEELHRYCEAQVAKRTLYYWAEFRPDVFELLVIGAAAKKAMYQKAEAIQ